MTTPAEKIVENAKKTALVFAFLGTGVFVISLLILNPADHKFFDSKFLGLGISYFIGLFLGQKRLSFGGVICSAAALYALASQIYEFQIRPEYYDLTAKILLIAFVILMLFPGVIYLLASSASQSED